MGGEFMRKFKRALAAILSLMMCIAFIQLPISVQATGTISLVFRVHTLYLNDCYFCSSFQINVIFVGLLGQENYKFLIKKYS